MYPDIEPFSTGMLKVSELHSIYYEESGNKDGNPVVFLHGGPGWGTTTRDRTFFDPKVYRIILIDQRGTGKSTPAAEIRENTTWDLVNDMEQLRQKLNIDKWVVFGGSWGSTMALIYAEAHPDRVKALIIRGIYTFRRRELAWFYQDGASFVFPDAYEEFVKPIPETERYDIIGAFYRRLTGNDEKAKLDCGRAWGIWAIMTARLYIDQHALGQIEQNLESWVQKATIECHYVVNSAFLKTDDQILSNVDKIRHIPTSIIHGRYDIICPTETAWQLHKLLPDAEFHLIPDGGHSTKDKGLEEKLVEVTDRYKYL
ncbi:probable proline iminopeptidase [Ruditapes philippinarum]|uniref:probable proline iminopeptidase n=1 Tax=Ruditapes philippinarum TaxID=129788 RepID=UPI00295C0AA9|nr:probable proline iminopeptidase [Ruditapes philippinarum]